MVELDRLKDGDIRICMYQDHPPPHIHAYQAKHSMMVDINTVSVMEGGMPKTHAGRVFNYVRDHQRELLDAWAILAAGGTPSRIDR